MLMHFAQIVGGESVGNPEASVRSRGTDGAKRSERDLIEAGLN